MEEKNSTYSRLAWKSITVTTTVVLCLAFFFILYHSSSLFLSALIGIGLASLMSPSITILRRRLKVPRFVGALSILTLIVVALTGSFYLVGSILIDQFDSFRESLPQIIDKWSGWWKSIAEKYPNLTKNISIENSSTFTSQILGFLSEFALSLSNAATGLTLSLVIALFGASNAKSYQRFIKKLIPQENKHKILEKLSLASKTLRKWFRAQLLDMLIVGSITTLGLWIAGIEYWALYGILTGILSIIPFVGIFIIITFSAAIVLVSQPDKIFYLLGIFLITQQLEGNFILPKLMKQQVQIPAAPLIFLMLLSGSWLGVLGVIVTPPLFAIFVALTMNEYPELKTKET